MGYRITCSSIQWGGDGSKQQFWCEGRTGAQRDGYGGWRKGLSPKYTNDRRQGCDPRLSATNDVSAGRNSHPARISNRWFGPRFSLSISSTYSGPNGIDGREDNATN